MTVSELTLSNFRLFEHKKVAFNPQFTLLTGENGIGKTSILDATAIAISPFLTSLSSERNMSINKEDALIIEQHSLKSQEYPIRIDVEAVIYDKCFSWSKILAGEKNRTILRSSKEIIVLSKLCQERMMQGDRDLFLPLIVYYRADRFSNKNKTVDPETFVKSSRVNGYVDCLKGAGKIDFVLDWFYKRTFKDNQNGRVSSVLSAILEAMEKTFIVLSGCSSASVCFVPNMSEFIVSTIDGFDAQNIETISQLSNGIRTGLFLVADIACRMATLNPNLGEEIFLKTSGIVLIDEMYLFIPSSIQPLFSNLLTTLFPKIQFIGSFNG